MVRFVLDKVEKIVEKGESAAYHHFLLSNSPEYIVLRVSYCDPSTVQRPWVSLSVFKQLHKHL